MSEYEAFVTNSKAQLDRLGDELSALENKVRSAGKDADDWSRDQLAKLKADWSQARNKLDHMANETKEEIDASWALTKADAENHWSALQAAIATYRSQVEGAQSKS